MCAHRGIQMVFCNKEAPCCAGGLVVQVCSSVAVCFGRGFHLLVGFVGLDGDGFWLEGFRQDTFQCNCQDAVGQGGVGDDHVRCEGKFALERASCDALVDVGAIGEVFVCSPGHAQAVAFVFDGQVFFGEARHSHFEGCFSVIQTDDVVGWEGFGGFDAEPIEHFDQAVKTDESGWEGSVVHGCGLSDETTPPRPSGRHRQRAGYKWLHVCCQGWIEIQMFMFLRCSQVSGDALG